MGYRYDEFAPGEIYHIFTRGVEKRAIFLSDKDRLRFLDLLIHYLPVGDVMSFSTAQKLKQTPSLTAEGAGLVDLLCYCLMDNHVHLLVRENIETGTSTYIRRLLNAYAKYFNLKQQRSGPLFLHPFKAVLVDDDEYFLHLSRYIHLNPYVAHMVNDPLEYPWSSLNDYIQQGEGKQCHRALLLSMMSPEDYKPFVVDEADYARSLADIQHLTIDIED